jgi:hypothetical protein
MWAWWRRLRAWREARRELKIIKWLRDHPDRIKVDGKRMKEWNRNRGH